MFLNIFTTFCYIFIIAFPLARSRKYDVEAESLRLYGEDFISVLRRFRRTSEYLRILDDRYHILQIHLQEIMVQTMQHIENKLAQKVATMVGYTKETTDSTVTTPTIALFRYKVRRSNDYEESTTEDPIRNLDSYRLLHRTMSTRDRNHFRDIGFEMAGQMVDLIIKGMGPVGSRNDPPRPGESPEPPTPVPSIHDHEVHSTTETPETETLITTLATVEDPLRYKSKRNKF